MGNTEANNRKSLFMELSESLGGKDAYIEMTVWSNGEGYDISINDNMGYRQISLTYTVLDAITHLHTSPEWSKA